MKKLALPQQQSTSVQNSELAPYVDILERAIESRDFRSMLIMCNLLLQFQPGNIQLIENRQAARIALGQTESLRVEFEAMGEDVYKRDQLAINYFDFLVIEDRFPELFVHVHEVWSRSTLATAKAYIKHALSEIEKRNSISLYEAEATLSCRLELSLFDRIILSFSEVHKPRELFDRPPEGPKVYILIDSLLQLLSVGLHATGIQRVICETILALSQIEEIALLFFRPDMNDPTSISAQDFLTLLDMEDAKAVCRSLLHDPISADELVGKLRIHPNVIPSPEDSIVILDCFWTVPMGRFIAFLDDCKSPTYLLIYDLVPLQAQNEPADSGAFESKLNALSSRVSGFIAISKATKVSVCNYFDHKQIRISCDVVPLASAKPTPFAVFKSHSRSQFSEKLIIDEILSEKFILTVSSISARKRILETAEAFLLARDAFPDWRLVIVGNNPGQDPALIHALKEVIRSSAGAIVWLQSVGDDDLGRLYSNCQFVTYLSRLEGWGLPVSEALSFGKLPLIHPISSLPEVGGDLAVYCNLDRDSVVSALRKLMGDESFLKKAEARIEQNKLRSWADVAADLRAAIRPV